MNLIIGIATYPRPDGSTYSKLEKTIKSIFNDPNLHGHNLKFIIVGDDYPTMKEELMPIFTNIDVEMYNIPNALRNMNLEKKYVWYYAAARSFIMIWEKGLEYNKDYNYLIISDDDEEFINNFLSVQIQYIKQYNFPDLTFIGGYTTTGEIYPPVNLSYPVPSLVFKSGTGFNIRNDEFIRDTISFFNYRWENLMKCIKDNVYNELYACDYEYWTYLMPKFKNNIYRSQFIPHVLINHYTQGSCLEN